jgi:hypothetical protein
MRDKLRHLGRSITDFFTGYYAAKELKRFEGPLREYSMTSLSEEEMIQIPGDFKRYFSRDKSGDYLILDSFLNRLRKSSRRNLFFRGATSFLMAAAAVEYSNEVMGLKDLALFEAGCTLIQTHISLIVRRELKGFKDLKTELMRTPLGNENYE